MELGRDRIMSLSYVMTTSSKTTTNDKNGINLNEYYCHDFDHKYTPSPPNPSNYRSDIPSPTVSILQQQQQQLQQGSIRGDYSFGDGSGAIALKERRKRNKTASAKYRKKKNKQQTEMKKKIDQLIERDVLLKQQVVDLLIENQKIKSMNDDLRGKILAQKTIQQYFDHQYDDRCYQINTTSSNINTRPSV